VRMRTALDGRAVGKVLAQFSKEGRLSLFRLLLTQQARLPILAGSWLPDE